MMVRVCTLHCIVMRKIHISTIYLLLLLLVHRLFFTIKYIKIIVLSLSLHIELVFLQLFFFFLRRPPLPSPPPVSTQCDCGLNRSNNIMLDISSRDAAWPLSLSLP